VFIRDLDSGRERRVAELPDHVSLGNASPDGRWFAYSVDIDWRGDGGLWLLDLTDSRRFRISDQLSLPLGWSPDGRLVAAELTGDHDIVLVDPEGGNRVLWSGWSSSLSFPVWLDRDRFVIHEESPKEGLVLVSLAGSRSSVARIGAGAPLAASPDGSQILMKRGDRLVVAKVDGRRLTDQRTLYRGVIGAAAVSDQGYVAYTARASCVPRRDRAPCEKSSKRTDNEQDGVWVVQGDARSKRVLPDVVRALDWSRDGSTILYTKGRAVYALTLSDGMPKRVSNNSLGVIGNNRWLFTVVP
jgi:hypothetical protein